MTSKRLTGKVALITGGGTGIGAAVAHRFAKSGADVVITGRRLGPLHSIAEGIGCLAVACNVGSMDDCNNAVAETVNHFGGLDILISNAGVLYGGSTTGQNITEWQQSFTTNVTGVMQMARAAIPAMIERKGGSIVNISSIAGINSGKEVSSYVSSKTAVLGLTRSLAMDYGAMNIRANTLCPGWVKTTMSEEEMAHLASQKNISIEEANSQTTQFLPLSRMAAPEEIAACAEFLASEDASFVTGTTLIADGGGSAVDVGTLSFN